MSNAALCTETKTFNSFGEYIDHIIEQNKKREEKEKQEYLKWIENIIEIGVICGFNAGKNLKQVTKQAVEGISEEDIEKEILSTATEIATKQIISAITKKW